MSATHKPEKTEKHTHPSNKKANNSKFIVLGVVLVFFGLAVTIIIITTLPITVVLKATQNYTFNLLINKYPPEHQ
jgi:uncharacterized membrane protein